MTPYWYQLLKEDGTFMGSDMVRLPADSFIADLRVAVKERNGDGLLKGISPAELTVYRNKTVYESKETHLEEDAAVFGLGESKKTALVVVVPNPKLEGINVGVNDRRKCNYKSFLVVG